MDHLTEDHQSDAQQLAHDILQSTTIIQALVSATRSVLDDQDRVQANLGMVEEEARVVAALCQRGLDGATPVARLDIAEVAQDAVVRMQRGYDGHIDVESDPQDDLHVNGNALDWERSFVNLIENACRAAGPDGKVAVRCYHADGAVRVSVDDSGPGFGAAPTGRSSLGMVGVSRLVDSHAGHIELRRSPLGGAQVTLVVPHRS